MHDGIHNWTLRYKPDLSLSPPTQVKTNVVHC